MLHRLFASCLAIAPLLAQTAPPPPPKPAPAALTAKSFLFDDARNIVYIDLAALRSHGIWDDLRVSVLKIAFQQMEKDLGCPLDALDRVTRLDQFGDGEGLAHSKYVAVFEGNRPLGVPDALRKSRSWSRDETQHGVEVWRRGQQGLFVLPKPELRVEGSAELLAPVLDGKPWSNRPAPDVMSLLSGAKNQVAYLVIHVGHPALADAALGRIFPDAVWPDGEAPEFLSARVLVTGDADDPHLEVEAVLRHSKGDAGLKVSQQAAADLLQRLQQMPTMRAAKGILAKAVTRVDSGDLVLSLELGRSRDAVGTLATLAMPLFGRAVESVPAQAAEPPPPPPPPAAEPKK